LLENKLCVPRGKIKKMAVEARKKRFDPRSRGYRSEKRAEKVLGRYGFRRVPLSGRAPSWPGDLVRENGKAVARIENKRRKRGFLLLRRWLSGADALRLDSPGEEPLYILREEVFLRLLEEAGYAD